MVPGSARPRERDLQCPARHPPPGAARRGGAPAEPRSGAGPPRTTPYQARRRGGRAGTDDRPAAPLSLPVVDLPALEGAARRALDLGRRLVGEARRPFDLSRDLMLRATLFRLGSADHVLLLVVHHVGDRWLVHGPDAGRGVGLVRGASPGVASPPALARGAVPRPCGQTAHAVARRDGKRTSSGGGSPWRGLRPCWTCPLTARAPRSRPSREPGSPLRWRCRGSACAPWGRESAASPFMMFLAGFLALLQRYTGRDDLVVGTPVGRTPPPRDRSSHRLLREHPGPQGERRRQSELP